jgi:hypothetical protein
MNPPIARPATPRSAAAALPTRSPSAAVPVSTVTAAATEIPGGTCWPPSGAAMNKDTAERIADVCLRRMRSISVNGVASDSVTCAPTNGARKRAPSLLVQRRLAGPGCAQPLLVTAAPT